MIRLHLRHALYLVLKGIKWPLKQGIEHWNRFAGTQVIKNTSVIGPLNSTVLTATIRPRSWSSRIYSNASYVSETTSNDFFASENLYSRWIRHKSALFSYILILPPPPRIWSLRSPVPAHKTAFKPFAMYFSTQKTYRRNKLSTETHFQSHSVHPYPMEPMRFRFTNSEASHSFETISNTRSDPKNL